LEKYYLFIYFKNNTQILFLKKLIRIEIITKHRKKQKKRE